MSDFSKALDESHFRAQLFAKTFSWNRQVIFDLLKAARQDYHLAELEKDFQAWADADAECDRQLNVILNKEEAA